MATGIAGHVYLIRQLFQGLHMQPRHRVRALGLTVMSQSRRGFIDGATSYNTPSKTPKAPSLAPRRPSSEVSRFRNTQTP